MSLAELSIKRPIFITCLVILMLVIGWTCFKQLSVDKLPDTSLPTITVTTRYSGAGPSEIETVVTKPLEDEISTISGLKRLTSTNFEGVSQITAEFNSGVDIKYVEQKIREKINTAKADMPTDIKEPSMELMDPSDTPIIKIVLSGDISDGKLYDVAEYTIKPALEQVANVGSIKIIGGRKREIHVVLDRDALKRRELSVNGVSDRLAASGENVPGGKVNRGGQEVSFRSMGEFHNVKDIEKTVVSLYGNEVPTRISDIGTVSDTLEDESTRVFVDGKKSLFIEVFRQSGTNTVAVADGVKEKLEALAPRMAQMDGAPKYRIIQDASTEIRDNIRDVEETIIIGILLTIIVVYLFLANGRSTIITAMALPNSLIGSFILMKWAGFSLNIISLLALSLSVGLLIDDAIVVRENIFRKMENGEPPDTAAVNGTKEVQLAVVATTLVILSVFAPISLMSGMMGMILKQFGMTICFAMCISLFDALTIAPMLSAYLGKASQEIREDGKTSLWGKVVGKPLKWFDALNTWMENTYERVLKMAVGHPLKTLFASLAVFVLCMGSFIKIPINFMPEDDNGQFGVDLELSPGASLDAMQTVAEKADKIIRANPEVEMAAITVGNSNNEAYKASLYIKLKPENQRTASTKTMKTRLRDQLGALANANPKVSNYDPTGSSQAQPIQLNLISTNQQELNEYAEKLLSRLKQNKKLLEVDSNYRPGKPEVQIRPNAEKAQIYGVNTKTMGDEIKAQVEGETPVKFRENGNEYDIRVRLLPEQRDLGKNYGAIYIPNVNQRLIKLTDVADIVNEKGSATIERLDRGRYIQIKASLAAKVGLGEVLSELKQILDKEMPMPKGMRYMFSGESENFQDMQNSMVLGVGFGILFIFFVLASLYESFITPFTIMLALPLAVCGAFVALVIADEAFSMFTAMGVIMLLGIACKNSILLVDYTVRLIKDGKTRTDALIAAGKIRLRPILMTSIALIAGMIPVAIGLNEASKQRTSMGVAVIGGLISSTLLTLIVVPAVFSYVDRFRIWSGKLLSRIVGYRHS